MFQKINQNPAIVIVIIAVLIYAYNNWPKWVSSPTPSSASLDVKVQCSKSGDSYWQKLQDFYRPSPGQTSTYRLINNGYGYSSSLKTCVIYYEEFCSPPDCVSHFHNYIVDDALSTPETGRHPLIYQEDQDNESLSGGAMQYDLNAKIQNLFDFEAKRAELMK